MRRFFSYYKPFKKLFLIDFTSAFVLALLELGFPIAVNMVVSTVLPQSDYKLIILCGLGLLTFYLVNTVLTFVVTYLGHSLGINIETNMRRDLYNSLQKQSFTYFDNHKTGKLMSRMTTDLFEISELAHHGPEELFIALMTIVGSFIIMIQYNVFLAVATVILVPIIIAVMTFFNSKMVGVNSHIYEAQGDFNACIESNFSGIRVIQGFANEEYEEHGFDIANHNYKKAKYKFYQTVGFASAFHYIMTHLITLFALFVGSLLVMKNEITVGEFVGYLVLSNVFLRPIERINGMIEQYPKGIAGVKRLFAEMDLVPEVKDYPDAAPLANIKGQISYDHVDFDYSDGTEVLKDINLDIKAGETIAFVGESGAGKSTICALLPRFYDVTGGSLKIDGTDIRHATLKSLRENVGQVAQDVFLFPGTIRENIMYGDLDANENQLNAAVDNAHLTELIASLPDGLDTVVGERGVKLSGGQKQRIAIARIFLKNPPILVLDEATSALDTETEKVIQESLEEVTYGRTTLIIAHRLATIKHADRIVVIGDKGIIEMGTHRELIDSEGAYFKLTNAQQLSM
ncbi:MAG: ABC transporter ATP-binding protein/permease [Lactobacillales bacterium]|jgi:ATP-binding cassette subfamily B protein|nr:ABC transporter ATP-binding protein/permease [Lactobacillales bacterium]